MRAFLRHDPAGTSPIGIAFFRVAFKGRTNGEHDDVSRVGLEPPSRSQQKLSSSRWLDLGQGKQHHGDGHHIPPSMPQLAHLIVGIFEKMIESLNANETEPWIFHIGHDVERDGQGSRKEHHVYPAMPCARGHTEPGEQ